MDADDLLFPVLFAMIVFGFFMFSALIDDAAESRLIREATAWQDISEARHCDDYRGMHKGRLIFECKDGKRYELRPSVVERAQQLREQEEGR